jgi:hypothetical protein
VVGETEAASVKDAAVGQTDTAIGKQVTSVSNNVATGENEGDNNMKSMGRKRSDGQGTKRYVLAHVTTLSDHSYIYQVCMGCPVYQPHCSIFAKKSDSLARTGTPWETIGEPWLLFGFAPRRLSLSLVGLIFHSIKFVFRQFRMRGKIGCVQR